MKAVYKREWQSYFRSPKGYIFAAIFIALCSFYFINGALIYQSADLSIVFSNMNIVYIFLVSILTMGLFANERSRKTDQLLLTSPVSITKIVWGKFCAALTVFGITLVLSLIYPAILMMFGNPAVTEMIGSYMGFVLLWSAFIAIGMFVSATTENQMIAVVVTFGILLGIFYMDVLTANISNAAIREIVQWFSIMDRYTEFGTGILNIESVVYYLSFIFVFVFLTAQIIKRRQSSDIKVRANNVIVTVVVIIGTILVNAIVSTVATKIPLKIDMTQEGIYEYSEETKEILAALDAEVELYALYPEAADSSYVETMREYLEQYEHMGDRIKVIYKDPYAEPAFVRQYGSNVTVGSVIAVCGERSRVVPFEELYVQSRQTGAVLIDAEKQLTSAIQYVSGKTQIRTAYFTRKHNEYAGADSELAAELKNNGYNIGEITIAAEGIPDDADLIILLAPAVDLTAEERDALDKYLLNGGKAAVVLSPGIEPMERLYSYLEEWGIKVNNDFVIENDASRAFRSQSGIPVPAPEIQSHRLTEKVCKSDIAFIAPNSCSLTLSENNMQNVTVTPLLKTSENSWGITDLTTTSLDMKDGDIPGPLTISAIAEKPSVGGGKLFVIGSLAAVGTGNVLNDSSYCNGDFVLDAFSYLADKGESVNIRAKKISAETLVMTNQQTNFVMLVIQYVLPILIMLLGVVVWLRRRHL